MLFYTFNLQFQLRKQNKQTSKAFTIFNRLIREKNFSYLIVDYFRQKLRLGCLTNF